MLKDLFTGCHDEAVVSCGEFSIYSTNDAAEVLISANLTWPILDL